MTQWPESSVDDDRLDEAFAEYLAELDAGRSPSDVELAARYPALAEVAAAHRHLHWLTAPVRDQLSSSSRADLVSSREFPTLPPGTPVGDYELLEVLGRGGMGVVYRARHKKFNLTVALKMLLTSQRATESQRLRFLSEVENQARLHHPHIVPVTGGGEHQGQLYFTMKWMEGGDLVTHVGADHVAARRVAEMMVKIAGAVHHAHQRRILHRDLKPSNILLDADGEPYVADFGLALFVAKESYEGGEVVGTPAYLAPEVLTGRPTVLSDVYGLGTVFHWLLTSRGPSEAAVTDGGHRGLSETAEPARLGDTFPARGREHYLKRICLKCLARQPEQRYSSADALAVDLQRYLDNRPPLAVPVRRWDRCRWWCARHPVGAGAVVALLVTVVLAVVAATSIIRSQRESLRAALALVELQRQSYRQTTQMQELMDFLRQVGESRELPRMFRERDTAGLQRFCAELDARFASEHTAGASVVASWFAVGPDATVWADSTTPGQGTPVADRDYTRWAFDMDDDRDVYESAVYKSRSDGLYKYAVATRIRDPDQRSRVVGALAASIAPESSRAVDSYESFLGEAYGWMMVVPAPAILLLLWAGWIAWRRTRSTSARPARSAVALTEKGWRP